MKIGVPAEIKDHETRVGLVPAGVRELIRHGHRVLVQGGAGLKSFLSDEEYRASGAEIVASASEVWHASELIIKVKEPQPAEFGFFRPGLILFTYLHLAPLRELTSRLVASGVSAIAYETVRGARGGLPLLEPMSEVAGRMAVQVGAQYLQHGLGGRGILLGGVPGVLPARVVVVGGGIVGLNAARIAMGFGASVAVLDRDLQRLRQLDELFGGRLQTVASNQFNIAAGVRDADLVIGSVLIPGASAPKLVTREMIASMRPGAVAVDVAIDQGGCFETSQATTHTNPTFVEYGVVHYCVTNMPAAVPRTSTFALTNATLPYIQRLADEGLRPALDHDPGLAQGLNTHQGKITCEAVAAAQCAA